MPVLDFYLPNTPPFLACPDGLIYKLTAEAEPEQINLHTE